MNSKRILTGILTLLLSTTYLPSLLAAEIAKPTVNLSIYGHVSWVMWVVRDLDPVLNYWEKLGLKITRRPETREIAGLVYRGKPAPTKARAAFTQIGGVALEWLQPVSGTNLYTEFLERHGDGILALGYAVKSEEKLAAQVQYFRSRGVELLQSTEWQANRGTGHRAYLDTAGKGGGQTIAVYYDPDGPAPAAGDSEKNSEPFNRIIQYAFVVHDVRNVGEYWQSLGFGGMPVEHNLSVNREYRGKPGKFEMDLGWGRFGDVVFEWIQPTQGPNVYEEYLHDHGEGLHHLAFNVPNMDAAVTSLEAKGAPPSMSGGWDTPTSKGRFAYLDTDPHGGVTIELLWNQPRAK